MDVLPSEDSSLKDKGTILGEEIDEIAACLGDITLLDGQSDDGKAKEKKEEDGTQSNELIQVDKQSHDVEKVEKNIEGDDNQVSDFHKGEITQIEENIEGYVTQSDESERTELSDRESNFKELLQSLQCPFSWKFESCEQPEHILSQTVEKIKEIEEEISFQWRHFILTLVLCYEYYRKKDIDSAFDELRKCEAIVNSSDSKGYFENFFQSTRSALLHVVLTCKCYLYLEKDDLDGIEKILVTISKEEEMDNSCKAAIWGIKGAVSMEYGYEGTKIALDYVKEALELDKEQGEWYFLLGKCLGRIRRIDHYAEIPTLEELKALEEAVKISRNPSYVIFLAQAYREAAFRVFSLNRHNLESALKNKIDNMNKRSSELYSEALELQGDCSHVNIRCAQGFHKLPPPYKDIKRAKECCEKALKMAPDNAMVHHIRGYIYEYERDFDNAKKHYEKSGELGAYGALMDLHRLEYKKDKTYNPIPRFEYMLNRFTEKPRREETLCQMGSYYFFIKEDLPTAYKYWDQVIKEDPNSEKLKTHKCAFIYMQKPVVIYELLYDEARLALLSTDSRSSEDVKLLREIVLLCLNLFPELDGSSPKPRRKMILDESYSNDKSRNMHRNRGGRGFQGQERRREGSQDYNRNRSQGNENANRGRDSSTRFIPRNNYSNADSRPGQRFGRRNYGSDWRANRDDTSKE